MPLFEPVEGVHRRRGRADHRGVLPAGRGPGRALGLRRGPARAARRGQGQGQGQRACGTSSCPTPRPARACRTSTTPTSPIELGKNPLASECLNCSAPDTGNMEVLERVGTPEQKEQWLEPLLTGEIRSAYAMTEPDVAVVGRQEHRLLGRARRRRVGDQRREVLHLRRRRPPLQDHDRDGADQPRRAAAPAASRRSSCRWTRPGVEILGPMHVFGEDDAPHGHMHLRFTDVRVPGRQHAARRGPGLRDLPGAPRPRPHPPLHALDRRRRAGPRADGPSAA